MSDLPLSETFREDIIRKLLRKLVQGESCSLIGVGSSGKSNVARYLDQAPVRKYYLEDYARHVLNLYVNCAKLTKTQYTARSLHCLILEVIMKAVKEAEPGVAGLYPELRNLWIEAIESNAEDLARSNLEDAFDAVFGAGIKKAFLTLDDFDNFFMGAPAPALNSLRALRDDYKGKIMYITVTRRELIYMRDPAEVEDFLELVVPATTFAVGPYSKIDAEAMVDRLAARETPPRTVNNLEKGWLLEISGRHPGLIKTIYKVTQDQIPLMSKDLLDQLREHPAISEECGKIWASLEESEKVDLRAVVSECSPPGEGIRALKGKGIVDHSNKAFSPVFENSVEDQMRQGLPVQLVSIGQVRVGDQHYEGLTVVESQLISRLVREYPKPASREQLLHDMHAAEAGHPQMGGSSERRLDTYFDEFKRKIEFDEREIVVKLADGRYRLFECQQVIDLRSEETE